MNLSTCLSLYKSKLCTMPKKNRKVNKVRADNDDTSTSTQKEDISINGAPNRTKTNLSNNTTQACNMTITCISYSDIVKEHFATTQPKKGKSNAKSDNIKAQSGIEFIEEKKDQEVRMEDVRNTKFQPKYFLDSKKNKIKLWPTMIDRTTDDVLALYTNKPCRCCHHTYETHPIGCPIRYIPHNPNVSDPKRKKIEKFLKDNNFSTDSTDYFETERMFCSFPCVKSYVLSKLSIAPSSYRYTNALTYLSLMYKKLFSLTTTHIIPCAHDIDSLSIYNGHLSIDEYRNSIGVLQFNSAVSIKRPLMFTSFSYMEETAAHTDKDYL